MANSHERPHVRFSPEVSDALHRLKQFNLERIYLNPLIKRNRERIAGLFRRLFDRYLTDLREKRRDSVIFSRFLKDMAPSYLSAHQPAEVVRDFIAGMTDSYFLEQCPAAQRPEVTDWAGSGARG